MGITMFYEGFYVRFNPPVAGAALTGAGYFGIVCIYLYVTFYQLGWGAGPWIYVSEISSARLRSLNVAFAAATQWLFNFVVARATPNMMVTVGGPTGYGTYFIFGSFCFGMFVFAFLFVPETKGIVLLIVN